MKCNLFFQSMECYRSSPLTCLKMHNKSKPDKIVRICKKKVKIKYRFMIMKYYYMTCLTDLLTIPSGEKEHWWMLNTWLCRAGNCFDECYWKWFVESLLFYSIWMWVVFNPSFMHVIFKESVYWKIFFLTHVQTQSQIDRVISLVKITSSGCVQMFMITRVINCF